MNVIKLFSVGIVLLAALLWASVASAATFTNAEWSGNTEVYGNPGVNKQVSLRVVVPTAEAVEFIETNVVGDGLGAVCTKVGGSSGLLEGTHNVNITVKLPPLPGTYDLDVDGVGIAGAIPAVDCEDPAAVHSTATFTGVIRVIPSTSTTSGDSELTGETSLIAELRAIIADLRAQINALMNPPTPAKPAYCSGMVSYNGSNAWAAQAWLLSQPSFNGGFFAAGVFAPTGFWGSISQAAAAQAVIACK